MSETSNLPGIFLPSRWRSRATFCLEITSPPSQKIPSISNQWNCSIPWYVWEQAIVGFRGRWVRIWDPFGWNPIGWLRTDRNSFFDKSLILNGIVTETVPDGFLEAPRSSLISIRLEIVLVRLETISDKQFNPFPPAIQKMLYPPTEKCCNSALSGWKGLNSLSGSTGCGSVLSS